MNNLETHYFKEYKNATNKEIVELVQRIELNSTLKFVIKNVKNEKGKGDNIMSYYVFLKQKNDREFSCIWYDISLVTCIAYLTGLELGIYINFDFKDLIEITNNKKKYFI